MNQTVVLMDINLPGMNGVECVKKVIALLPEVQVIMLTVYEDNEHLFNSLLAGANGYQLKRTHFDSVVERHSRSPCLLRLPNIPHIAAGVAVAVAWERQQGCRRANPTFALVPTGFLGQLAEEAMTTKGLAHNLDVSMGHVCLHIRNTIVYVYHSQTEAVVKFLQGTSTKGFQPA